MDFGHGALLPAIQFQDFCMQICDFTPKLIFVRVGPAVRMFANGDVLSFIRPPLFKKATRRFIPDHFYWDKAKSLTQSCLESSRIHVCLSTGEMAYFLTAQHSQCRVSMLFSTGLDCWGRCKAGSCVYSTVTRYLTSNGLYLRGLWMTGDASFWHRQGLNCHLCRAGSNVCLMQLFASSAQDERPCTEKRVQSFRLRVNV